MKPATPPASRLRTFGLTVEDYEAQLSAQDGKCAICGKNFTAKRPPANDHNHRTGEYRGLLCLPCNDTLGRMHENSQWFENAFLYLTNPPARDVFVAGRWHRKDTPED